MWVSAMLNVMIILFPNLYIFVTTSKTYYTFKRTLEKLLIPFEVNSYLKNVVSIFAVGLEAEREPKLLHLEHYLYTLETTHSMSPSIPLPLLDTLSTTTIHYLFQFQFVSS